MGLQFIVDKCSRADCEVYWQGDRDIDWYKCSWHWWDPGCEDDQGDEGEVPWVLAFGCDFEGVVERCGDEWAVFRGDGIVYAVLYGHCVSSVLLQITYFWSWRSLSVFSSDQFLQPILRAVRFHKRWNLNSKRRLLLPQRPENIRRIPQWNSQHWKPNGTFQRPRPKHPRIRAHPTGLVQNLLQAPQTLRNQTRWVLYHEIRPAHPIPFLPPPITYKRQARFNPIS